MLYDTEAPSRRRTTVPRTYSIPSNNHRTPGPLYIQRTTYICVSLRLHHCGSHMTYRRHSTVLSGRLSTSRYVTPFSPPANGMKVHVHVLAAPRIRCIDTQPPYRGLSARFAAQNALQQLSAYMAAVSARNTVGPKETKRTKGYAAIARISVGSKPPSGPTKMAALKP